MHVCMYACMLYMYVYHICINDDVLDRKKAPRHGPPSPRAAAAPARRLPRLLRARCRPGCYSWLFKGDADKIGLL